MTPVSCSNSAGATNQDFCYSKTNHALTLVFMIRWLKCLGKKVGLNSDPKRFSITYLTLRLTVNEFKLFSHPYFQNKRCI
jgi:hypothetical protein